MILWQLTVSNMLSLIIDIISAFITIASKPVELSSIAFKPRIEVFVTG